MNEWKRIKAVRRFAWVAIAFTIFPGAFFIWATTYVSGPTPEAMIALLPAVLMGALAAALHFFQPARLPATDRWRPEEELLTPVPRRVEARWSTPMLCLPWLLWLFPAFFLLLVVTGVRELDWTFLSLLSIVPAAATGQVIARLWGRERRIVACGEVVQGVIRRIVTERGSFRMKVQYQFGGQDFYDWTPNLSRYSWFGPLLVEERKSVTLLVDPDRPERFVVYPFSITEVAGGNAAWVPRML